jgi:hypothetical protein
LNRFHLSVIEAFISFEFNKTVGSSRRKVFLCLSSKGKKVEDNFSLHWQFKAMMRTSTPRASGLVLAQKLMWFNSTSNHPKRRSIPKIFELDRKSSHLFQSTTSERKQCVIFSF